MRGVDDVRMMQADRGVVGSQRILLFGPQSKSSAAIDSIVRSLEAKLDTSIRWGQAQLLWHIYVRRNIPEWFL